MKTVSIVFCLAFLGQSTTLWGQMTLFGDVYIAPGYEMYLAHNDIYFDHGCIYTDRGERSGVFSFAPGTQWENIHETSYIDGFVRVYDPDTFVFPIGHDNVVQRLTISDFYGADHLDVAYQQNPHSFRSLPQGVDAISDTHFWEIHDGRGLGTLTLEWNAASALHQLFGSFVPSDKIPERLTIGGYTAQGWEVIPSEIVALEDASDPTIAGSLKSAEWVDFSEYSAFTLMALSPDDITTYQVITTTGDGKNDVWVIEGIEKYPQAHVSVYNRWGEEVFSAKNGYQNDWRGHYKSFSEKLPTGPYFYLIDLDNDGTVDKKGWLYITD